MRIKKSFYRPSVPCDRAFVYHVDDAAGCINAVLLRDIYGFCLTSASTHRSTCVCHISLKDLLTYLLTEAKRRLD